MFRNHLLQIIWLVLVSNMQVVFTPLSLYLEEKSQIIQYNLFLKSTRY